jgi:hypothetical protein
MVMMTNPARRNLSGVYIFDTLPGDKRRQPTVFEDCTQEKQQEWLDSLTTEALKNLAKMLGTKLRDLGDMFDIMSGTVECEGDDEDEVEDLRDPNGNS